ncbi:MAG: O-antigen ligase family protein, partial [Planctomycetaceae bacterium]
SLIWEIAFHHIRENPWLGVGPGRPRKYLEVIDIYHAHNDIIQVAMETGLLSSALYTLMIGLLLTMTLRSLRRDRRTFMACLPVLAYFAYSWTGCPLGLPPATLLLAVCVNEARLQFVSRSTAEQSRSPRPQFPQARSTAALPPIPVRLKTQL